MRFPIAKFNFMGGLKRSGGHEFRRCRAVVSPHDAAMAMAMAMATVLDPVSPGATSARVFDALTGGGHNFLADRNVVRRLLDADPAMYWWAAAHQHFRLRAMMALADAGIRQWIDLGCGMATPASAHGFLSAEPSLGGGRLVCIDHDPVVITHLRGLPDKPGLHVTALCRDLRDPHVVMADITRMDGVDLGEPVAILLTGVLHHLDDDAATGLLAVLRDSVTAGSHLVLSHPSCPQPMTAPLAAAIEHCQAATDATWTLRDTDAAPRLLGAGWTPQPPGITRVGCWSSIPRSGRPDLVDDEDLGLPPALRAAAGWAVLADAAPTSSVRAAPPRRDPDAAGITSRGPLPTRHRASTNTS